jgi:hypothetical protein
LDSAQDWLHPLSALQEDSEIYLPTIHGMAATYPHSSSAASPGAAAAAAAAAGDVKTESDPANAPATD